MDEWRAATDAVAIDCYEPAPTAVQAAETTHIGAPTGIITARQTAMMSRHSPHRLTVHHFSPVPTSYYIVHWNTPLCLAVCLVFYQGMTVLLLRLL